jgi:hypothetical protein
MSGVSNPAPAQRQAARHGEVATPGCGMFDEFMESRFRSGRKRMATARFG